VTRYVRVVRPRITRSLAAIALSTLALFTACSNDSTSSNGSTPNTDATSDSTIAGDVDLASVCPSTVVIQTDWWPQAEHGFVYELLGPDYTINTDDMSVTGALVSQGQPTGVDIQINAGGPAVNFDPVIARLYSKPEILLGFTSTDIAISQSEQFPTIGVVAPFNISPQILMWDPATYPEVRSINELKDANVPVLYFRNVAYMKYLTGTGILSEEQVRDTYDGFPEQFITANGTVAQQGFGTNEPIFYETQLEKWMKPIRYQYLHELGWNPYVQTLAVTPDKKTEFDDCLRKLVPIVQKSQHDYALDPARTNQVIVDVVKTLNPTSQYNLELAAASADKQVVDRLISNSPDGTLGSFDLARVADFIDVAAPIYIARGDSVRENLTSADLVTNEYIDTQISLPEETAR
jgi:hypothetical protein